MNIFEHAMSLELEGEGLYRSLAKESEDKGVIYIFTRLADQERRHYGIFQRMKEGRPQFSKDNIVLKSVRDIFEGWRANGTRLNAPTSQVELYRKALDVEEKSVRFYEENAWNFPNEETKAMFLLVAGEEKHHRKIMENIIEFVTKPERWAENAEFGYRGEDYYL